jgi:hypothetical protein
MVMDERRNLSGMIDDNRRRCSVKNDTTEIPTFSG